ILLITSDHGNCDQMRLEDGTPHTAHTLSDAPFILISNHTELRLRNNGLLADIAPTVLQLLGIVQPSEMSGRSLIQSV
ncbi:MAG: 2,3-bisphosphoglycerate-independent phosphoglycerate mutase, partial [Symbiobacteriaceae bacterium]|nr:2,3-bisphosphoglycerate-independent phosphoglycerate mutase [Symbiobacteriaceae bacterium]